jgi:hypothetical protein
MAASKAKTYIVYAISRNMISRNIFATGLDEALLKAKEMKESEFVNIVGECVDGDFWIQGVISDESFDDAPRH